MKTTKSIAAYAMLLGTLLATDLVQTAHADECVEVQNIVCGMRSDIGGHLMIESSGIRKNPTPTRGVYRDRGKSSPKIAHGMYRDRGKSSPKIAERALQSHRYLILDEIDMALELGEFEMADELLYELNTLERVGR